MCTDGPVQVHRTVLSEILQAKLSKNCTIHTNKRLVNYGQASASDPVTLHFSDGSQAQADVLCGADGVRSPTRGTMFQNLADAHVERAAEYLNYKQSKWSGTVAYRGVVSIAELKKEFPDHQAITQTKIASPCFRFLCSTFSDHGSVRSGAERTG